MGVSVIILTKNSQATIRECLDSVSQNNPEEVIVVDGYSTDGTLDIVREHTDNIYYDEGKGLCYARQLGAEMSNAEYVFYVDSDVVLQPDTIRIMLAELEQNGYGALAARALRDNATKSINPGEVKATVPMFCTLFPRELILKYGFDPSMPDCDDFEICYKLLKHGHKIALSSAYATHRNKDRKTAIQHLYRVGKALAEFTMKYWRHPSVIFRYVIIRGLGSPVYGMLFCIVKGRFRLVLHLLGAMLAMTAGFISKLMERLSSRMSTACTGHKSTADRKLQEKPRDI